MARALPLFSGIVCLCFSLHGQTAPATGPTAPPAGFQMPTVQSLEQMQWSSPPAAPRSGFLKELTIESFGYGPSPFAEGFESPLTFTNSTLLSTGLECPRCIPRPAMERTRFTLPPFGAQATLPLGNGRTELFANFGGINAWKPDNSGIEPNRRGTSFNDAWLLQGHIGSAVALDPSRHVWVGPVAGYLRNFGEGKQHWNTVGGFVNLSFWH
jgi:hypothetical protein